MLIPSYAELMDVLNKESEKSDEITSRYTIVIAAAKRARQIIQGDDPMVLERKGKPLSTAVDEIFNNKIKVVPEGQGTILVFKKDKDDKDDKDDFYEKNEIDVTNMEKKVNNSELDNTDKLCDELEYFDENIESFDDI